MNIPELLCYHTYFLYFIANLEHIHPQKQDGNVNK